MTSCVVALCQPWFYLRLKAYSFLWLSEGAYSLPRDSTVLEAHSPPNGIKDTHPRTKASEEPKSHHQNGIRLRRFSTRRLSCLLFQMFCVETNSFLPNQQSDGRDLAS